MQEAWIRWQRTDVAELERPQAWLTTVTSRLGLDRLRARQRDRAEYVGPWLPEPLIEPLDGNDPARAAEVGDSLTTAFLVLMEQLSPEERLVLLLADVFGEPFPSVARTLGKSEAACRQMAVRARRKVRVDGVEHRIRREGEEARVAREFVAAVGRGDLARLEELLAPDVVIVSDGGAKRHAARRPVVGFDRVTRLLLNLASRLPPETVVEQVGVNGRPGVLVTVGGRPLLVQSFEVVDGRIVQIHAIVNPDKLRATRAHVELI